MKKIWYLMRCLFGKNSGGFFEKVKIISKEIKRNKLLIALDMLLSVLCYGADFNDYYLFDFYKMNAQQRKTFMTRQKYERFVKEMNDEAAAVNFDDKSIFCEKFGKRVGRDYTMITEENREQIFSLLRRFQNVRVTPVLQKQIKSRFKEEKILGKNYENHGDMLNKICMCQPGVVEPVYREHENLKKLNKESANTVRIFTINKDDKVEVLYAFLHMEGRLETSRDIKVNDIFIPISLTSGKLERSGCDKEKNVYERCPGSIKEFSETQVPYWSDVMKIARRAASRVPQIGYAEWEIIVAEKKPVLSKGSCRPIHDIFQMPVHVPDREGAWAKIDRAFEDDGTQEYKVEMKREFKREMPQRRRNSA